VAELTLFKTPEAGQEAMRIYDAVLARWPVPYQSRSVSTRFGDTFVITCGDETSPALVLLHGAGTNSATWFADIAALSREFRVYAVDLIGEPGKSAPSRPDLSGPAFTDWMEDVLAGLKLQKVSLVGMSLGGWAVLKFAIDHPERVEKLVLMCTGGVVLPRASFLPRVILFSLLGKPGYNLLKRMFIGNLPLSEDLDRFMAIIARQFRSRIEEPPVFSDEQLRRLNMPVMVIAGAKDAVYPSARCIERLRRLVPRLTDLLLPEAGHALAGLGRPILSFLKGEAPAH
jgi:pimeloyl-ACP methyl ester carboxylesterase